MSEKTDQCPVPMELLTISSKENEEILTLNFEADDTKMQTRIFGAERVKRGSLEIVKIVDRSSEAENGNDKENSRLQATSDKTRNKLQESTEDREFDPWKLPEVTIEVIEWSDLDSRGKVRRLLWDYSGKILVLLCGLYLFVCSLDILSNGFRLLGGKTAGSVFRNNRLLQNPVAGLMIGVLTTTLLQSSSTTMGIVISLIVSKLLDVRHAIPIVMGANIGTSVTNTLVSLGQVTKTNDFRRAFAGATVHDMFNWLAVLLLLPIETATGYLYHLTKTIVSSMDFDNRSGSKKKLQFLKTITKPFTNLIIQVDKKVIQDLALGKEEAAASSIIKHCCRSKKVKVQAWNVTLEGNNTYWQTEKQCLQKCRFLFEGVANIWSDATIGGLLLVISLVILSACFVTIVKILYSVMRGKFLVVLKKYINSDFPGKCSFLTGYLAILIGTGVTMIVQSSSVVTSALTPIVGVGILSIERMYPITLGANLGTTFTAILIALSQSIEDMPVSFQVALCHVFFNISGILIFYPVPYLRVPIQLAKFLGNKTARYRWFCGLYLVGQFVLLPLAVFGLTTVSWVALAAVCIPVVVLVLLVLATSLLQRRRPSCLPSWLRTWDFLPVWLRSLEPYDTILRKLACTCCRETPSSEPATV